jgi:hypothetical protein
MNLALARLFFWNLRGFDVIAAIAVFFRGLISPFRRFALFLTSFATFELSWAMQLMYRWVAFPVVLVVDEDRFVLRKGGVDGVPCIDCAPLPIVEMKCIS